MAILTTEVNFRKDEADHRFKLPFRVKNQVFHPLPLKGMVGCADTLRMDSSVQFAYR